MPRRCVQSLKHNRFVLGNKDLPKSFAANKGFGMMNNGVVEANPRFFYADEYLLRPPNSTSTMVSSAVYPSAPNSLTRNNTTIHETSSSSSSTTTNPFSTPSTSTSSPTSNPFTTPPPSPPPPRIPSPLRPAEARIRLRYAAELHEIAQEIVELQQEQEEEELLHSANMTWLRQIGADEDKVQGERGRHEGEVRGLVGLVRLAERHVREVVRARERRVRRLREKRGVEV